MYNDITHLYHLIFADWDSSMRWQGARLNEVIRGVWGGEVRRVLDVTCGIGTQAIALAKQGFEVTASDLSRDSIARARVEAEKRGVSIQFSTCDMRHVHDHHGSGFDLVITCDNSIPHLLDDAAILDALKQMHGCVKEGGGVLISLRDYADLEPQKGEFLPYGLREHEGMRYAVFQTRDFHGDHYDVAMYFVAETDPPKVYVGRSRYYAVSPKRVMALMQEAGFSGIKRQDDAFYQPILLGHK